MAAHAIPSAGSPLTAGRGSASERLLDRTFGRRDITDVRHAVSARLESVGLSGDRLQGFVLAVNEVITNAVLHAGGHGRLDLWTSGGSAVCAVTDSGPGIPERFRSRPEVPAASEVGGRGVWLAYQLCDEVSMNSSPGGTTVTLRVALPDDRMPSKLVDDVAATG